MPIPKDFIDIIMHNYLTHIINPNTIELVIKPKYEYDKLEQDEFKQIQIEIDSICERFQLEYVSHYLRGYYHVTFKYKY